MDVSKKVFMLGSLLTVAALFQAQALAGNAAKGGAIKADPPNIYSIGLHWFIHGDANKNAKVSLAYRKVGAEKWISWMPLFRAFNSETPKKWQKKKRNYFYKLNAPVGAWRFAGGVWDLLPDTAYEMKVNLSDPDGGSEEKIVALKTRAVPARKGTGREIYVTPIASAKAGADGSKAKPLGGLVAGQKAAKPGDTVYLLPGIYKGSFGISKDGKPGKPIVYKKAPGKGEAILDGQGSKVVIGATNRNFITFDGLTIQNGEAGYSGNGSGDITFRYCVFKNKKKNLYAQHPRRHPVRNFFVADCTFLGASPWPRTKGIEPTGGIDLAGYGHTVCYNRISKCADGISVNHNPVGGNRAIDIFNNEISEATDDGIEGDYGDWNIRIFRNRLTDVYQAISSQPGRGGPTLIFRNTIYNVGNATFKMHNYTSGNLICNNTTFKTGTAIRDTTPERAQNTTFLNNLFVGTGGGTGMEFGMGFDNSRFDYNALVGAQYKLYIRWNRNQRRSLKQCNATGSLQKHGHFFKASDKNIFEADLQAPPEIVKLHSIEKHNSLLKSGSPAIDKGLDVPGITAGFKGAAPDLGAFEFGDKLPHYGPRSGGV